MSVEDENALPFRGSNWNSLGQISVPIAASRKNPLGRKILRGTGLPGRGGSRGGQGGHGPPKILKDAILLFLID